MFSEDRFTFYCHEIFLKILPNMFLNFKNTKPILQSSFYKIIYKNYFRKHFFLVIIILENIADYLSPSIYSGIPLLTLIN